MCYTGKCIYEDYMGNCTLSKTTDETCKNGYRLEKQRKRYFILYSLISPIIHIGKYIFSKRYRKECKEFKDLF